MDKLFAVITTYNGQQFIEKCINSLINSSAEIKIIVVDNNSGDDTVSILKSNFPEIVLFELNQNLGFGRANNIGLQYAYENGAEHVLLLNQDAWVYPETVEKISELQKSYPEYGILSPLHLNGTESELDTHFSQFVGKSYGIVKLLSDLLISREMANVYPVEFVNAAIWMVSRSCIEKVGLFNPSFIHYGEDREYAQRARFFGFNIGICPEHYAVHARVQHSISAAQPFDSKYIQQMKAEIIFRLSRFQPVTAFNLISVFSYILLLPKGIRLPAKIKTWLHLMGFVLMNIRVILKNRNLARSGGHCFFHANQITAERYDSIN